MLYSNTNYEVVHCTPCLHKPGLDNKTGLPPLFYLADKTYYSITRKVLWYSCNIFFYHGFTSRLLRYCTMSFIHQPFIHFKYIISPSQAYWGKAYKSEIFLPVLAEK